MVINDQDVRIDKVQKEETGLSQTKQSQEEKLQEEEKTKTFQDEMKLSISEIISKRFKNKIKVYEATNPSEIENLIIRPPSAANGEFQSSQLTSLGESQGLWMWSDLFGAQFRNLTEAAAQYMRYKQHRLMSLAQRVRDSFPTSFNAEASPTDLLTGVHRAKLAPQDISLLQISSQLSKTNVQKMNPHKHMKEFANYGRSVPSSNKRNIILLIVVIVQVIACCALGKVCIPPMVVETKLEHNSRKH